MMTILTTATPAELYYTLYPFLRYPKAVPAVIVTDEKQALRHARFRGHTLVVLEKWLSQFPQAEHENVLVRLKDAYTRLVFVEDSDSPHSRHYHLIGYFDLFYQKQLLRDTTLYAQQFVGNRYFCDYYARTYGLEHDTTEHYPVLTGEENVKKLRILWNLGYGQYPLPSGGVQRFMSRIVEPVLGIGGHRIILGDSTFRPFKQLTIPKCQARFSSAGYRPLVGYQRELFSNIVSDNSLFLSGRVPRKAYYRELKSVQAVLSPFGWGEVCYRDFEAIIGGSVLVKPDMSHLDTWPDVFVNDETYLPLTWDGSDLIEKTASLLDRPQAMAAMSQAAQERYRNSLDTMKQRLIRFFEEATGHG
jgi:hypothetical protein